MSDDLRIPVPSMGGRGPVATSYRARRAGPESGLRMLTIGVVAAGGLLLAGLGGWAMMGRKPVVVPVIEADTKPLRVKPDNAGGMQVAGADEMVLGGAAGGNDKMAPAAEAPAPQALRAQMQQTPPPAPLAEAPAALAPNPAPPAPAQAPAQAPALADLAPRPAARSPASAPLRPVPAGNTVVQLAALDTEAGAQTEWQRLAKKMPELLADRRPTIQKAERDGHTIWRVRTGGFTDVAEATEFCTRLRAKGGNCTLAVF